MTINELLRTGIQKLKEVNIEAPALEAGVMLCHVLDCDKTYLYTHGNQSVDNDKADNYADGINRRCNGVPLQYITGHQEFMSLDFVVTKDVLIPRQDTEILVEHVLEHFNAGRLLQNKSHANVGGAQGYFEILDMGTGSGCIAVSLAHFIKNCRITAVDFSKNALEVAKTNGVRNFVDDRVQFVHSNLFEQINSELRFDAVVSNPPYIETEVIEELSPGVRDHEPVTALDGGKDGLHFYRKICEEAIRFLKPGGLLAFEIGYNQAEAVSKIMDTHYSGVRVLKDLAGLDRVVSGYLES
ncbi:MAG: peptide chain release factor N(5)-glutamine methyltransferase [Clostridia bacterium]|nr:peptide chain release factor N(5)-glutamine methyltransferase [Clostridia bacterium]